MSLLPKLFRIIFMMFYSKYLFIKDHIIVSYTVIISNETVISKNTAINTGVNIGGSFVGYGTFIGELCKLENAHIGAYCSLGQKIQILIGTHPSRYFVSTHPAFFSLAKQSGFTYASDQSFQEELYYDKEKRISVKIGNDVWIGNNVLILGGIEIGNGAIIGAGSLVTKDVPPYSIVAGIPAKIIRFRFDKEQIEFLMKFQWWNKSPEWLRNNVELFKDISLFSKNVISDEELNIG